jgi:hypothetical protein
MHKLNLLNTIYFIFNMSKCRILLPDQYTQTASPRQIGHFALYCKQKMKQVSNIFILSKVYSGAVNMAVNYKLILKCSGYFTFMHYMI